MTVSVEEAVDTLYTIVDSEPYKSSSSWVNTKTFELTSILEHKDREFIPDRQLDPK